MVRAWQQSVLTYCVVEESVEIWYDVSLYLRIDML